LVYSKYIAANLYLGCRLGFAVDVRLQRMKREFGVTPKLFPQL